VWRGKGGVTAHSADRARMEDRSPRSIGAPLIGGAGERGYNKSKKRESVDT